MTKRTFHGSCHCGAHRFEAAIDLGKGTTKCNCTSCWKHRRWSVAVATADFHALAGDGTLSGGRRGFCTTCGVAPYDWVAKAEWNDGEYVSVNVAALDDLDPRELLEAPVRYCDGRANAWMQPPEVTAHL